MHAGGEFVHVGAGAVVGAGDPRVIALGSSCQLVLELADELVLGPQLPLVVDLLRPQLGLELLDPAVQGPDLDFELLGVGADVDVGDWLRAEIGDLDGHVGDLPGEALDDLLLNGEDAGVGHLLLPLHVAVAQQLGVLGCLPLVTQALRAGMAELRTLYDYDVATVAV